MANKVFIATSLDGYIAESDGGIRFLDEVHLPPGNDGGYNNFISNIDAIVMGRNSYEKVLSFDCEWPYKQKVFVLSHSLIQVKENMTEKVEILKGEPREIVRSLTAKGFKNLYIDGGKTIQGFLRQGLIDEMTLTRIPIILGEGIPLLSEVPTIKLEHCQTVVLDGGLVQSRYKIIDQ